MKIKLYKKFIKLICKQFKISKKQLFSKDFKEYIIPYYKYNFSTKLLEQDSNKFYVLSYRQPLSQIWKALDFHTRWLIKYWKYSHWKAYIQIKLDVNDEMNEIDDIIYDILNSKQM